MINEPKLLQKDGIMTEQKKKNDSEQLPGKEHKGSFQNGYDEGYKKGYKNGYEKSHKEIEDDAYWEQFDSKPRR